MCYSASGVWHRTQSLRLPQRLHGFLHNSNLDGSRHDDGDAGGCAARHCNADDDQHDGSLR